MVAQTKPLGCCLLAAATLLLLGTLARCQDETRSNWTPFRPTDGTCHEIGFVVTAVSTEVWTDAQLADDGATLCSARLPDWQYVRTERSGNNNRWKHYCRHCGLPRDSVLMWFGNAPSCSGSCPAGWVQITPGVFPGAWIPKFVFDLHDLLVDGELTGSDNSPQFGHHCSTSSISTGKVLCALGGRPASVQCSYTWRGTAPDCRDACEPGETLVAKDWYGDGKRCLSGTYNKMLCERCQAELLNLNDCTTPTWFGTAPLCAGECNVGDRVMARAQSKEDVPADQDPGGFGKPCSKSSGWKVRCHLCSVKGLQGSGPLNGAQGKPKCSAPQAGHAWAGYPLATLRAVKTYAACCQECHDAPACRRFHVGPAGCSMFADAKGVSRRVAAGGGRVGGGAWQAGSKLA